MLIGGLERSSFIDFPGCLSAVVFTRGCNLRCGYCHNPTLVRGDGADDITAEAVLDFLATRRGMLGGVVVSGGEPTLQPDLAEFCERVRTLGFRVKLDTNGTRPDVVARLLTRGLLDYVALDLKDTPEGMPELSGAAPDEARGVAQCLRLLRHQRALAWEVRTTVVLPRHSRSRLERMARLLRRGERWFLQRYRPGDVLDPAAGYTAPPKDELQRRAEGISRFSGVVCSAR